MGTATENPFPLPLPLGEVAEQSEDGEGRHVKKTCRWHVFSVDLGSYAAVASILNLKALSYVVRADRVVRPYAMTIDRIS